MEIGHQSAGLGPAILSLLQGPAAQKAAAPAGVPNAASPGAASPAAVAGGDDGAGEMPPSGAKGPPPRGSLVDISA
jgi:hypothetical protein